jgi:hypothetical protein
MFQLREHCMLGDRSAQLDVDIQTILTGLYLQLHLALMNGQGVKST